MNIKIFFKMYYLFKVNLLLKLWIWYLPLNFRFLFHERSTIHKSANIHKSESESRSVVSDSLRPRGLYSPWNSPGQNTGVGSLSLLQGNLPNPGIEPRSPALKAASLPAEPQGKPQHS